VPQDRMGRFSTELFERYQRVTAEPVAVAYNKALLPAADTPKTHTSGPIAGNQARRFQGELATYDPERSCVGFLFITRMWSSPKSTWDLVRAQWARPAPNPRLAVWDSAGFAGKSLLPLLF
jgi:hypothetical protein